MSTLLIRGADVLVTMDDLGTEIPDGGLYAEDGWITQVGASSDLPTDADEVIDARGTVVLPGLVNTHHHLAQTLTRAVPAAQDAGLFDWLVALYPMWARITPDHLRVATTVGLAELALSGCTTAFDHNYLWPGGTSVEDQVEGADPVGIRFVVSRGSMSVGESAGGLPPDRVVEDETSILADTQRVVEALHDRSPGAMLQVAVAPCSPFTVSPDLMRESAALARSLRVRLHTHLAETIDEQSHAMERFGRRPVEWVEDLGWHGEDVWFAHAVHVSEEEQARMGAAGTGVAHCPTSNMRLASGIAPVRGFLDHGVPVGLGVDGSASNDGSHMLAEARQALLLARLSVAPGVGSGAQMSARAALRLATRGGAEVLGRTDIGSLEVGKACDAITIDMSKVGFSGAHDPVAAVLLCAPTGVRDSVVHGKPVVRDHTLVGLDLAEVTREHQQLAGALQ